MVEIIGIPVFRYDRAAGQEVVTGLSWDMVVLFAFVAFFVFLIHFIARDVINPTDHHAAEDEISSEEVESALERQGVDEIRRFTATQRASHWIMAASVFLLMLSGFIMMNPGVTLRSIAGISWVDIHIIFSIVLIGYVVFHVGHVAYKGTWRAMWIGVRDLRDQYERGKNLVGLSEYYPRQFQYPSAQKFLHLGVTLATLGVLATGLVMLRRIDVFGLWEPTRDFSFLGVHFGQTLGEGSWGLVTWSFVLHDLFAIFMVALVLGHIYFALRPDEWPITKSMVTGYVSRETYAEKYSPHSWRVEGLERTDGGETESDD